jgi:pimeloyl-ACP methyl ester carboxylesterase
MAKLPTQYFDCGDVKIAYTEAGRGPVVLLLHGNSASKAEFTKYQQEYFQDFHTFAIDSRGHGETVSNDAAYSFDLYSDDVLAFCTGKGIHEAYIIGYSDGGNLSLHLAKKAPQLFKKVIAISPNYLADGVKDGTQNTFRGLVKFLNFLGKLGLHTKKAIMRFELMTNDIGLSDSDLQGIRTQFTIVYAENDLIKEDHIQQMAGLIPGCGLEKIMNCSHFTIPYRAETIAFMRRYLRE